MGNSCDVSAENGRSTRASSDVSVPQINIRRLEKQLAELRSNYAKLERARDRIANENVELEAITQQLLNADGAAGDDPQPDNGDRAGDATDGGLAEVGQEEPTEASAPVLSAAEAEGQLLREQIEELQERRQHLEELRERVVQLEQEAFEPQSPSPPPAGRETVALRAERRALRAENESLKESLATVSMELEDAEEVTRVLSQDCILMSGAGDKGNDVEVYTWMPADVVGRQIEIGRLQEKKAALEQQCRSLAELAERRCALGEQAWFNFEHSEQQRLLATRQEEEEDEEEVIPLQALTVAWPLCSPCRIPPPSSTAEDLGCSLALLATMGCVSSVQGQKPQVEIVSSGEGQKPQEETSSSVEGQKPREETVTAGSSPPGDKQIEAAVRAYRQQALTGWQRPVDKELQAKLPQLSFRVARQDATEPSFQNKYWDNHKDGVYVDVVSGEPLYASTDKFDSGTGWPSFVRALPGVDLGTDTDYKIGYARMEMRSPIADSHLGHIFDDGPVARGGMRHCVNSAAMRFVPAADMEKEGLAELKRALFPGK